MKSLRISIAVLICSTLPIAPASADSAPQTLPFSQNWTNTGLITADDNWSGVPGIEGFLGQNITTATGTDPQTLTGTSAVANDLDVIANQANPNTLISGGIAEFDGIANPAVAPQGSGTADAPYLLLHLITTGQTGIIVNYNLRDIEGSVDNSIQPVALQYRVGTSGAFTNVPAGFVADASSGPSLATLVTPVSVNLTTASAGAVDNQPEIQVRVITANAVGSDEWIGIDDISVTGTAVIGTVLAFNPATLSQPEGDATGMAACAGPTNAFDFTVTATPPPLANLNFTFSTADGSANSGPPVEPGDPDFTAVNNGAGTILAGQASGTATVQVNCDDANEADQTFTATLQPGAGYTIQPGAGTVTATIVNDDGVTPIDVSITDVSANEGNVGTSTFTFVVSLSQPAPAGGVTFDVLTSDDTAAAGTDYVAVSMPGQSIPEGAQALNIAVTVNGDLTNETNETFFVDLRNVAGMNLGMVDNQGLGTILNDDTAPATIAQIQGNGISSPFNNTGRVTIGNIVTSVTTNGFTMQMPSPGDGDALTSDAIFVFTGGAPTVAIGDIVDVQGTVIEFPNSGNVALRVTEFSGGPLIVNIVGSVPPAGLPTAIVFDDVFPSTNLASPTCVGGGSTIGTTEPNDVQNFECFEGMRITTSSGIVTAPNLFFASDPLAEMFMTTASASGRALREPGIRFDVADEIPPTLTPPAPPLPASPIWDGNPDVFELDHDKVGLPNNILVPGTRFSATGVLGFEFNDYEFWPVSLTVDQAAPALPVPVPVAGADQLTVASLNLLRLFNDVNDPGTYDDCATQGTQDFCPTTLQFQNNLGKRSAYIRTVLRTPMVLGLSEVENLATVQSLATRINTDLAGAFTYTALMGTDDDNDPGHINNAFLVRNDVTVDSTQQFRTTDTFVFNGTVSGLVFDRPPFLLLATTSIGGAPLSFAVVANHLRSLSGIDTQTPASALVDAHRVRQKRLRGAALLATEVQAFQTANPTVPLLVTGDMNAFEFPDGYADINGIIRGEAVPSQSEYNLGFDDVATGTGPDGNIVTPVLTAGLLAVPPPQRYSFIFGGSAQVLDHGFMSQSAVARFEGFAYGRGNCDAPVGYETDFSPANLPLRSSDHDAFVIYLNAGSDPSQSGFVIFKGGFEDPPPP